MLVLKKNDPNVAITPDATRATLYIDDSVREVLSIKQSNGYVQLLTFHDSNMSGNLNMAGNIIVNSGQVIVNGNLTAANIMGPLANGTSSVRIATAGGNAVVTVAGTSTMTVSATGANITGTANISANTAIGGNLAVTGGANVTANLAAGNANIAGELLVGANANVTANLKVTGNTLIVGNLQVQGNTTYIDVSNLNVQDPIISIGGGPNGAPLTSNDGKDRGTALQYFTTAPVTAFMGWDNGNSEFTFGSNVTITNEVATYNQLGNIRAANFIGTLASGTSNVSIPVASGNVNIISAGNSTLVVSGTGANVVGTANISGNTAIGGNLAVTGNITATNITATLTNGSSNVAITANGNVTVTSGGVATAVVTSTGANITGTANITGLVNMGSNLVVVGNVTATNFIGLYANGSSNVGIPTASGNINLSPAGVANVLVVTATGANIAGTANVSGVANVGGNLNVAGNGAVTGNLVVTANATAGNFVGTLANGNTAISMTSNGNVSVAVTGTAGVLVLSSTGANITGTANVSGNANVGNLGTAGQVVATGNVTGSTILATAGTLTTENATGNLFISSNTTTVNMGLGASTMTIGANGVQANIRGILTVGNFVVGNTAYYSNGTGGNFSIGYRDIPQVVASANVTLALTDAGKHFYANGAAAFNITIPANNTVALPIGTAITIAQAGANSVTIVPASGVTLRLAGSPASSGNRTLSSSGLAALLKVEANIWYISGSGVA